MRSPTPANQAVAITGEKLGSSVRSGASAEAQHGSTVVCGSIQRWVVVCQAAPGLPGRGVLEQAEVAAVAADELESDR